MENPSPRGTYLTVSDSLARRIGEREFIEELPPVMTLATTYGVSRSTIERALLDLKAKGAVESVKGAAWYVAGTGDRRPLVDKLTDLLRESGVRVGDAFPTEAELCKRFEVSRTAVRSAIAQLEGRGLIGKNATRGRRVCALPSAE